MDPRRDEQLIADLQALRPTPRPQFAAELDERAAAGFPRRSRLPRPDLSRFRVLSPKRVLIPAAGFAVIAIAVVTALLASTEGQDSAPRTLFSEQGEQSAPRAHPSPQDLDGFSRDGAATAAPSAASAAGAATEEAESGVMFSEEVPNVESRPSFRHPASFRHRAVERSAQITLAADPKDVDEDASRVFEAVHAHNGIVMRSSTEEGRPGEAGAWFELLIPSTKLDDAMAAFSDIDAVRSRHETTADITAPTVSAAELLKESRARIDSLLAQLEAAETEEAQEAIEGELRHERRHASRLAAQLTHLHKRADYSRVSLQIETGGGSESSGGGAWGIEDALDDAGHVLTVAAAVTLIALAVLGPIALLAFLAWLTHRVWVRRERRRVLS
ncbi:MAG TPA: DUF4349 domain-containing protein [Solirubrobacterales bacterium]|jgi:hypothetical protein|nr:DUF4349 domain-containing protein [Solirubrobacterales bacterium]